MSEHLQGRLRPDGRHHARSGVVVEGDDEAVACGICRVAMLEAVLQELYALAAREEALAVREASETPYWASVPPTVAARHHAASALRECARRVQDALLGGDAASA